MSQPGCDVLMVARFRIPISTISARCSKAAGSADRILRNGPQVAAHFVWLSGHVDDRCCGPRYGGPGRAGEGGWRAGLYAAGRQRRPCAGVQQQQWPRVEIPDGSASEVVESSEYAASIAGL